VRFTEAVKERGTAKSYEHCFMSEQLKKRKERLITFKMHECMIS